LNVSSDLLVLLIVLTAATLLAMTLMELKKRPKKPEYETRELLECVNCKYRIEAPFEPGDFITMRKGKCPKCGTQLKIIAIYDVEKKL